MGSFSKLEVESVLANCNCSDILHPWTQHCSLAALDMLWSSCRGTYKYFAIIYLLQLLLKGRKVNKQWVKNHVKDLIQSCIFGSTACGMFIGSSCILRYLLGKYTYYTVAFLPGTICGLSFFIERPVRRNIIVHTFFQMTLEYFLRKLESHGLRISSVKYGTIVFMFCNAVLLYLIKSAKSQNSIYWFCVPPSMTKTTEDGKLVNSTKSELHRLCTHQGSCSKFIIKSILQYAGAGIGIQILRSAISKFQFISKAPFDTIAAIIWKGDTFKLAAFLGAYIGIYKCVSCLLYRMYGDDSDLHAIPAGFLAGIAYCLHPERSFGLAAFTTILQLSLNRGVSCGMLPDIPYGREMLFCLSVGILGHARFIDNGICPGFITKTLSAVSNGRFDNIYRSYVKLKDDYINKSITLYD